MSAPAQETFARRLIACLDVRAGRVVKGVNFEGLRDAGDPAGLAARYDAEGIDELVVLDVTATTEDRLALARTVSAVAARVFIPLAVGGGIRSVDDAARVIEAGADKIAINTAAIGDPALITRVSARFGSQAVVVAIDAKREAGRFVVCSHSGRTATSWEAVEWAREAEARGAGEILLTSIDADGTLRGFDCRLTAAVSEAVGHPRHRVRRRRRAGTLRRGVLGRARGRRAGRVDLPRPHVQRAGRQGAAPRMRAARQAVRRHADSLD